jgi:integrase
MDITEARQILSGLPGKRLRPFVFHIAAFGARPIEIAALLWENVDMSKKPYKYYLRAEYSKNKIPREVYGTVESDHELDTWLARCTKNGVKPDKEELVFASNGAKSPLVIYSQMADQFGVYLDKIHMGKRVSKDDGARRKITFYSFRRYVETMVEDHTSANFADYILGHKKSPYYNKKENERRDLWEEKCHAELIYLDYNAVEKYAKKVENENQRLIADRDTTIAKHEWAIIDLTRKVNELSKV